MGVLAMRFHILSRLILTLLIGSIVIPAAARERGSTAPVQDAGRRDRLGILVLDGSGVHDAGNLLLHTGNWGIFGSYPNSTSPIAEFPSAEWPAGSGVEHLYIAGLWFGATKGTNIANQVPHVSTAAYHNEFLPTDDPLDRIYHAFEGMPGGMRLPSPHADDDGDGMIDEDPLDGHDNDGDGMIDEDFAAVSNQMFSSWYTDNQPGITGTYPEHEPMPVLVRQESYQWTDPRFDDFVGITFTITHIGVDTLLDHAYVGFFVDGDIGRRGEGAYWEDDAAGSWRGYRCTELGPAHISMGYMYDADGDGGRTTSYIGAMILGHPTAEDNYWIPDRVGMTSFRIFSSQQPYENGGIPTNDFERYDAMTRGRFDRDQTSPGDYQILISVGEFSLAPGQSITVHMGLVAGDGLEDLLDNAAMCQKLFDGMWFDADRNPRTGFDRRETMVLGPVTGVILDPCRPEYGDPRAAARGETLWVNMDCEYENEVKEFCMYEEADSMIFRTGVAGRETHVNWMYERPPMPGAALDIKPGSCPNPFNVNKFEYIIGTSGRGGDNPRKGGVLPVAVLGGEGFDVHDINQRTLRLEGVPPLPHGTGYEDVSSPAVPRETCACNEAGPDGYTDLVLKFSVREIADAMASAGGIPAAGEDRMLTVTGALMDGTAFMASDCVHFVGPPPDVDPGSRGRLAQQATRLTGAQPNPFNPVTTIGFELSAPCHVTLSIYDAGGRHITTLVDRRLTAGPHDAVWNGRTATGAPAASGVYFYRLVAGEFVQTKKMVLLR
jgi:hypothetical protein